MAAYSVGLGETLLALSRVLIMAESQDSTLARVVHLATHLESCDMAGMTVVRDGRPVTVASTAEDASALDDVQYAAGRGPCLAASHERAIVRTATGSPDPRWPEFSSAAAGRGVSSVLSLPLLAQDEHLGTLSLYSRAHGGFGDADEELAALYAERAAVLMANARDYWQARQTNEQLETALQSRDVIGQAKGILMARRGVTADQAFNLLRQSSHRTNVKLRDLADQVVFTGELPES